MVPGLPGAEGVARHGRGVLVPAVEVPHQGPEDGARSKWSVENGGKEKRGHFKRFGRAFEVVVR